MDDRPPAAIAAQVSQACRLVEQLLASPPRAIHLYGSAVDGGLKPWSDIDLLVTVDTMPDDDARHALMVGLLRASAPPGERTSLRALEVTLVVHSDVVPWRYPPRRALQFGEWLRHNILAGVIEPPATDPDLTILLTHARQHSIALRGAPAHEVFDPVPEPDFRLVLADTLGLWNSPADWEGDERNIVLTLARIWYSTATGRIAPKDIAADWAIARLPATHRSLLEEARDAYLGQHSGRLICSADRMTQFVQHLKSAIRAISVLPDSGQG